MLAALPRPSRLASSFIGTAGTLTLFGHTLATAGQASGPAAIVGYAGIAGFGLMIGCSREAPGGVRLADLNTAVRCPGVTVDGPQGQRTGCANHFHPPRGEFLVPVELPSGRTANLCSPCARALGQGGPVVVQVEVLSARPLGAIGPGTGE